MDSGPENRMVRRGTKKAVKTANPPVFMDL